MRRLLYAILVLTVGVSIGWYKTAKRGYVRLGGLVRVSECSGDFGTVPYGTRVRHSMWLTNISSGTLYVDRVKSKATVSISKKTLQPRDSVEIAIEVDTSKGQPGVWNIPSLVYLRNLKQPLVVALKGYAMETFPTRLNAGDVLRSQNQAITYRISPAKVKTLQAIDADYPRQWWNLSVTKSGTNLQISLTPTQEIPYGSFRHKITLITNDAVLPEKTTIIKGRVLDRIVCQPDHISLMGGMMGEGSNWIDMRSPYGDRFSIVKIRSSAPEIRFKSSPGRPSTVHKIIFSPRGFKPGPIEGEIEIVTKDPARRLKIPFYGVSVRPPPPAFGGGGS